MTLLIINCRCVVGQGFMYLLIYTSIQDKLQFCMLCLKHVSDMFVAAKRFQVSDAFIPCVDFSLTNCIT